VNQTPLSKRQRGRPSLKKPVMAREALLRSALTVFSQKGFDAASVREIAAGGGVDSALIRHHFGSKLELWQAVVDFLADKSQRRRDQLVATVTDKHLETRELLTLFIESFLEGSAEVPEMGMFISHEATSDGERIAYIVERLIRPLYNELLPIVKAGIAEGVLAAQNPKLFFFMLVHAVAMPLAFPGLLNLFGGAKVGSPTFNRQLKEAVKGTFLTPA